MNRRTNSLLVCVLLGVALLPGVSGCLKSRNRPAEIDTSGIPAPVLEQFRRDFPNGIILGAAEVPEGEGSWPAGSSADGAPGAKGPRWRITQFTPLADEKDSYYSREGVRVGGW